MASLEEAMARLQALEDERAAEKQSKLEDEFMSHYGNLFSNHRGLGVAIFNELNRRGIDTSAADEAVQDVLNELRMDTMKLSNLLNNVQEVVAKQTEKVESTASAVQSALANNPNATGGVEASETPADILSAGASEMPPPEAGASEMPPPEAGASEMPPPEAGASEMPPPEAGASEMPPPEAGAAGNVPPPEAGVAGNAYTPSDERIKKLRHVLSDARAKHVKAKAASDGFKPSATMIEVASRGW